MGSIWRRSQAKTKWKALKKMLMMKRIVMVLWVSLLCSCSKDEAEMVVEADLVPSFVLVGLDTESVYQYNYDGLEDSGETFNLSQELGMGPNYLTLRQEGEQLSFYTFSDGAFSLYQKNVLTGAINSYVDFYENTDARSIVWGTNDMASVYFGYYSPRGSRNLALYTLDLAAMQGEDTSLEFNIQELYQPLYEDGRLYITYQNGSGTFKLIIYDTVVGRVLQNLDYGSARPSIFITDNGNLAIIKLRPNGVMELEVRAAETLAVVADQVLNLNQVFLPGPLNAQLVENKLYYEFEFAQPFRLTKGPAIYDLSNDENTVLDIEFILNQVTSETGGSYDVISSVYNSDSDAFLLAYRALDNQDALEGGVLAIASTGQLLKRVPLPFFPTYFLE
jgi:hypothetical protein